MSFIGEVFFRSRQTPDKEQKEQDERIVKASRDSTSTIRNVLGISAHAQEAGRQRREITDEYRRQVRNEEQRIKLEKRDMHKELEKEKEKIYSHYEIERLRKKEDPRLEKREALAQQHYAEKERHRLKAFDEMEKKTYIDLKKQRDDKFRSVSRNLHDTYRRMKSSGL